MHVLICHERLLFRFGADRVLLLLGKDLAARGHRVSFIANKFDTDVINKFAYKTIKLPASSDYALFDGFTTTWLKDHYENIFTDNDLPDIIISGGWPFFSSISFFRSRAKAVLFMDFGMVPADGYGPGMQTILSRLDKLKRTHLPEASFVTAISNFILQSQTLGYCQGLAPSRAILLGADHLEQSMWTDSVAKSDASGLCAKLISDFKRESRPIILNLGRFEPGCYKNSEAVFKLSDSICKEFPNAAILILADSSGKDIPDKYKDRIYPIGFPSDLELNDLMRNCALGVSVSLWEGFNLPLAEMQWLEKPALALNIGAHSEVAADPWYLCKDISEMGLKAKDILRGNGLALELRQKALSKFKSFFRWERFAKDNEALLLALIDRDSTLARDLPSGFKPGLSVIIDVTNACADTANSGVIRVTRRLGRELSRYVRTVFVVWDAASSQYVLPSEEQYARLGSYNGPLRDSKLPASRPGALIRLEYYLPELKDDSLWFIFSETVNETVASRARAFARSRGIKLAAIFYDAIAILRQELCNQEVVQNHANYMRGLAECDVIIPISGFSGQCLKDFWKDEGLNPVSVSCNLLPAEFAGKHKTKPASDNQRVEILCVSTLEPRKNHKNLLKACEILSKDHPELAWRLTLVGNRYAGDTVIAPLVEAACAKSERIRWLGVVDDDTLGQLYLESDFTVYPSQIEGFGMPILESLWHQTPCLCHDQGVMSELAAAGGCLCANVFEPLEIARAMVRLISDKSLRLQLRDQTRSREYKTWDDYAKQFYYILRREDLDLGQETRLPAEMSNWRLRLGLCGKDDVLADQDSLALSGLLSRLDPKVAVEVCNQGPGLTRLIARHCKLLYRLGQSCAQSAALSELENLSMLEADPVEFYPQLLAELGKLGLEPDFIALPDVSDETGILLELTLDRDIKHPFFLAFTGKPHGRAKNLLEGLAQIPSPPLVPGLCLCYVAPAKLTGKSAS